MYIKILENIDSNHKINNVSIRDVKLSVQIYLNNSHNEVFVYLSILINNFMELYKLKTKIHVEIL